MTTVKVGIIGCGVIGSGHLRVSARSSLVEVVAVADVREEAARQAAQAFNVASYYASADGLLADPEVEAVVLALPAFARTEIALRAFAANKQVLLEKPVAMNAAEVLERGYAGTSHKNCKGVFKGIANACLIAHRARHNPGQSFILSAEDLTNVGPVALLQDLAVVATLGISHAERNGQYYFRGASMLPKDLQHRLLAWHGDLYHRHERGFATLDVKGGAIKVESLVQAPFGVAFEPEPSRVTPLAAWEFDSLASPADSAH